MRTAILAATAMAAATAGARDDPAKDELRKFKGTWIAETREYEGQVEKKPELKGLRLVVEDDKFVLPVEGGQVMLKGSITVTPSTKPKAMDVKVAGKDGKEVVVPAIYEMGGTR